MRGGVAAAAGRHAHAPAPRPGVVQAHAGRFCRRPPRAPAPGGFRRTKMHLPARWPRF